MLGTKRVFGPVVAKETPRDDYESDTDSCMSVALVCNSPATATECKRRRGFAALIVTGEDAVAQFERDYPTQFDRCLLAKNIERQQPLPVTQTYSVRLEKHDDWRVGSEFTALVSAILPENTRSNIAVIDVGDWNTYDFWGTLQAPCNSTYSTDSPSRSGSDTDDRSLASSSPTAKRARFDDSTITFGEFKVGHLDHGGYSPSKSARRRSVSRQVSPLKHRQLQMTPTRNTSVRRSLALGTALAPLRL